MLVSQFPKFAVDAAYGKDIRVKWSSSGVVTVAGDEEELGTTEEITIAATDRVAIMPKNLAGVRYYVASKAISEGADVYTAASGKISDSGTYYRGVALEAASGNGSRIRVFGCPSNPNTTQVTLTGSEELTNKTLTAQVVKTGLTASGSASNDFSGSTGTFKTSSGAGTLSGHTLVANGKTLGFDFATQAAGTTGAKTAIVNQVVALTCADASNVFATLPDPAVYQFCMVVNNSAQTADVYPYAAESIDGTTHKTIATYKGAIFVSNGTNWVSIAGA